MPITYTKQSHTKRLIEPFFSRFRQKYRATRNSKRENLEMNSLIVDFNRIDNQLDLIDASCNSYSASINGKIYFTTDKKLAEHHSTKYKWEAEEYKLNNPVKRKILST